MKTLSFNNDVVVEVFNTSKGLYDFNIYTDVNNEKVECDHEAYYEILDKANVIPMPSCYEPKEIMQVLRKVKEATHETHWKLIRTY